MAKAKTEAQPETPPVVRSDPGKRAETPINEPKIIDLGGGTIRVDN
jgi:hypothetical protein